MLKIVSTQTANLVTTLQLEGRVVGPWVAELRRTCDRILSAGGGLILDLFDVSFVDRDGVGLLQELQKRNVKLNRCSGFVAEQLKA